MSLCKLAYFVHIGRLVVFRSHLDKKRRCNVYRPSKFMGFVLLVRGGLDLRFLPYYLGYHILSFPNYSRFLVGSDGAILVTPGAISVNGHISTKLHHFYAIRNLNNFANWSRLVWLSHNLRKGTSLFEMLP